MPKRPRHHRVQTHAIYTVAEAADVSGVCRQTVIRWIKEHGLPASMERKPWLIRGCDLKPWLIARRGASRRKLGPGEIYCLPCRRPQRPDGDAVDFRARNSGTGMLIGICPACNRMMHRVVRRDHLDLIASDLDVAHT